MRRAFLCCFLSAVLPLKGMAQCSQISIALQGTEVHVSWIGNAQLEQASSPLGPWHFVADASPYNIPATASQAFFRLAITQQVFDRETLFFYNKLTGRAAIGAVEGNSFFTRNEFAAGSFSQGWTHVVQYPGQGDTLLFYNRTNLSGALGTLSVDSFSTFLSYPPNSFADWSDIAAFAGDEGGQILYYNENTGNSCCYSGVTLGSGWTDLVETRHSRTILLYKASNGSGLLGFDPPLVTFPSGGLPSGASHIATSPRAAGGDFILFYRASNQSGELGVVDSSGYQMLQQFGAGAFGLWTHVAGLDHGYFFYNSNTGEGAIGVVNAANHFVTTAYYDPDSFSLGWTHIVRANVNDQMQGFSWPMSVRPGETMDFYTSTGARTYTVSYVAFRNANPDSIDFNAIQNNRELVEELVCGPFLMTGHLQNTAHTPDQGCFDWDVSFSLTIPNSWQSGMYAAKLLDASGSVNYVPFVVNPDPAHRGNIALIANVTTWNAYNPWGGYSRYSVAGDGAWGFSYLRPNHYVLNLSTTDGGYQYMSKHLARGEFWVLNWLKQTGYDVDVYTDLDLHEGIADLADYKAIILSTHPEYFSVQMLDELNNYLDSGGSLFYLGGNGIYDAVDVSDDLTAITIYGTYGCGRSHLFRRSLVSQPESATLGVAFPWSCADGCLGAGDVGNLAQSRVGYRVLEPNHRFFAGTGLGANDLFGEEGWCVDDSGASGFTLAAGGASGWEVDVIDGNSPPGVQLLALGMNPLIVNCAPYSNVPLAAHMTYYDHPGGGFVFSVGSMSFGGSLAIDPKLQQIMRNALDDALSR